MDGLIYPIHFQRDFERRWAARIVRDVARQWPAEGTDTCVCGATVTAPIESTYSPAEIANDWECSACGKRWKTIAPGQPTESGGQPTN
jgi:hypothetical protein